MKYVLALVVAAATVHAYAQDPNESLADKLGVEKRTHDMGNTRTDTYTKELGKTDSGNGYGVYGSSSREYRDAHGERDTSANEVPGSESKGAGVYIDFE